MALTELPALQVLTEQMEQMVSMARMASMDCGDSERTRHYAMTDVVLGHAINRVYRIIKWDVARLNRELLDSSSRRALYDKISEVFADSIKTGRPGDWTVSLPIGLVPGGRSLSRQITYRLTKEN